MKSCSLACREQCQVSAWASWSSCQAEGCYPGQPGPTKGVQTRTRSMVNRGESSSCPALGEVRACSLESCYHWAVVGRGPCSLQAPDSSCGVGRRQLEVECRLWDGSKAANSSLGCQGLQKPRERLECSLPCPQDCIVGAWAQWSSCPPLLCPPAHRPRLPLRQRNRTILATAGAGGRSCPGPASLVELAACPSSSGLCQVSSWHSTPWADCQLAPGYTCGQGVTTRRSHCQANSGSREPDWRCSKLEQPVRCCAGLCEVQCGRYLNAIGQGICTAV